MLWEIRGYCLPSQDLKQIFQYFLIMPRPLSHTSFFADMDSDAAKRGITMELCAGCVDKHDKSLADIATEEGTKNK